MSSEFGASIIKIRSRLLSESTEGFILIHVLVFYMLFTSMITAVLIAKNLSLQQNIFYKMAKVRIQTEKDIISIIKNHDVFPKEEELTIEGQHVIITYDIIINVLICGEMCYTMRIEYDQSSLRILSIDYE